MVEERWVWENTSDGRHCKDTGMPEVMWLPNFKRHVIAKQLCSSEDAVNETLNAQTGLKRGLDITLRPAV